MLDGNLLADLDGTIEGARQRRVLDDGHVVFLGDLADAEREVVDTLSEDFLAPGQLGHTLGNQGEDR